MSKRDANWNMRVRSEDLARWRAAAERDGRTISDWIARTCNAAAVRP